MKGFAKHLEVDGIRCKYAQGATDFTGREFHLYHEVLLFLGGDAQFTSDCKKHKLIAPSLIIIPKEKYHRFDFYGDVEKYCRCVFSISDVEGWEQLLQGSMDEVKVLHPIPPIILRNFERIMDTMNGNMPLYYQQIRVKALLSDILVEVTGAACEDNTLSLPVEALTQKAVAYIHSHYGETITVQDIARYFHVSASSLSHTFKQDLHISVYRYIINKRLITAQKLLGEGVPAMQAATQCGFGDYAGFYRAYSRYFRVPPHKRMSTDNHKLEKRNVYYEKRV